MPTALITWASSGIGFELARIMARDGFDLVLVARRRSELEKIVKEFPHNQILILEKDLSLPWAPEWVYQAVQEAEISIRVLVNNAGFGDYGYFHEIDIEKEKQMIDLNVRALTELTYLFGRDMVEKNRGKILNIASTAAFQPGPLMAVYYATKHYVLAFSEAIAEEWGELGVTVTALCPGPTKTGFVKWANLEKSKLFFGKKLPTAHEVALFGYHSLEKKKRVAIHGLLNRIMAWSTHITPNWILVKIVKKMQEKR